MNRRLAMQSFAVVFLGCSALEAADVTGKWTAQIPGRGGQAMETTFVLKQDGATLTGTMSVAQQEAQIQEGKVDGDTISFSVTQAGRGGTPAKIIFKGTVSGGEIKFTRQREGGEPREFTAKRAVS